ncbi:MAG: autotransporter-associated beta strand repeat-containing protein [Verrucomicrobiota bacterium]
MRIQTLPDVKRGGHLIRYKVMFTYCLLFISVVISKAAVLSWDADSVTSGAQDGSGNWGDPNLWWNGSGNVNWVDANDAVFGIGTGLAGNYTVTNNIALRQPVSVTFTNPGVYTITTDGATTGQLGWTAAGGGVGVSTRGLWVGTNVNARIDVPWRNNNGSDIFVGSNSVLTFSQGHYANNSGSLIFKGAGAAVSTINATNGTLGGPTGSWLLGTMLVAGTTFNVSGAAIVNVGTRFDIGRTATGASVSDGIVAVSGGGQLNINVTGGTDANANLQISRGSPAAVSVQAGGSLNTVKNSGVSNGRIILIPDSGSQAKLDISGGTVNVGTGAGGTPGMNSSLLNLITLMQGSMTYGANASAIFNLSGGTVTAQGLQIGSAGGNFTANPTNQVNISGGTLYLDAPNISRPGNTGTKFAFNLSGATIGATANWSPACTVPMNLTNINGDVTFQSADIFGTPFNISLAGALTGVGGLKKTGAGNLTLSGANNYAGTTTISNGTLTVSTVNAPTNGPVILEGASVTTGLPVNSVVVAGGGQFWSIGNLTYNSGMPTADFNFGSFPPSTAVAAIQVNGNLSFAVTPNVSVSGSAIAVGDYPLWHYSGTLSGAVPTTPTALPGGTTATLVHNVGAKTIVLHVTVSPVNPALTWRVGNGVWDVGTTANWAQFGAPVTYSDGKKAVLDDSATGPFPVTITLNATVTPTGVQVNSTNSYIITGSGNITGSANVEKNGSGVLTLAGTNTYTGGTTVNAGTLNLNYGGDGVANSAIGTGPWTNNLGAKLDNTSGHAVTLLTPIAQFWNDDFTFLGSTNLNLGSGAVTLGSGLVSLTVNSNMLEVDGVISDNGLNYGLGKAGNGALTLSNFNSFGGGMQLNAGTLNVNSDGAIGTGTFAVTGGTIDNGSGAPLTLSGPIGMQWNGSFSFLGSADLTLPMPVSILSEGMTLSVNTNAFTTTGGITGGNRTINKAGAGTWTIAGGTANSGVGININQGTVNFNKDFGANSVNANPVTVNTNGTLVFLNPTATQVGPLVTFAMNGGVIEMNGDSATFSQVTFNSGILRNTNAFTASVLHPNAGFSLVGTNCEFGAASDATLNLDGIISNSGWLVKSGAGLLNLSSNNTYTGRTLIKAGTLALTDPLAIGGGSISNSAVIDVAAGATLDVLGRPDQTLMLNAGQTLSGNGAINGTLVAAPGSIVAPGASVGALYVSNNITLAGTLALEVNRTNAPTSDKLISVGGTITYGGSLTVSNVGPALQVGDSFQLFPAAVTTFGAITLVTTDANGKTYVWNNKVAVDGSIQVTSVTDSINPNPGTILTSLSGNTLSLSWPTNGGWILQTNAVSVVDVNAWFAYPNSAALTSVNIPVNPTKTNVFFRLVKP